MEMEIVFRTITLNYHKDIGVGFDITTAPNQLTPYYYYYILLFFAVVVSYMIETHIHDH